MQRGIERFVKLWRQQGWSVTPKIHFIEDHAIEQMRYLGYALGKFDEQGGESLHAMGNKVRPRYGKFNIRKIYLSHYFSEDIIVSEFLTFCRGTC